MSDCPNCGGELDREDCDYCDGWGHIKQGVGAWAGYIPCPDGCDNGSVSVCLDCGHVTREED